MPPALNHKKTRTGCARCKARKVKCDEAKPKCSACSRHSVECEYLGSSDTVREPLRSAESNKDDPSLELRLMHEWAAYTCETLAQSTEFWKYEAPLVALKFRFVLDAMFALAALHLPRRGPRCPGLLPESPAKSQSGPSANRAQDGAFAVGVNNSARRFTEDTSSQPSPRSVPDSRLEDHKLLDVSRRYFARALEGHRKAVTELNEQSMQAVFICAILISLYALFTLSENSDEPEASPPAAIRWIRLSRGTLPLGKQWHQMVGSSWFSQAGLLYGEPDLSNRAEVFRTEHREAFSYLLSPVEGDRMAPEDQKAFEDALSFIGLMHKGIVEGFDSPLATIRRIVAMPAVVPTRFIECVEESSPRAIAVLAHFFAIMKLTELKLRSLEGIAQCQVPKLCEGLPQHWMRMVEWPLQVVERHVADN